MNRNNNYEPKAVAVGTSDVELLPLNTSRTALVLFNQGPNTVRFSLGVPAAYVEVIQGQGIHFDNVPLNSVSARTATGSSTITVWEA